MLFENALEAVMSGQHSPEAVVGALVEMCGSPHGSMSSGKKKKPKKMKEEQGREGLFDLGDGFLHRRVKIQKGR